MKSLPIMTSLKDRRKKLCTGVNKSDHPQQGLQLICVDQQSSVGCDGECFALSAGSACVDGTSTAGVIAST